MRRNANGKEPLCSRLQTTAKASERTCENSDEHRSTKVEGSKEPTTFPDEEKRKERQEEEKKGKEETLN